MKYCSNYTGITCIDGNCPIARSEDYNEYGIDVPKNCKECSHYKGCEDCAWFETEMCIAKAVHIVTSDRKINLE